MRAPEATDVKVGGDFVKEAQALNKGDDGVWSGDPGSAGPSDLQLHVPRERRGRAGSGEPMIQLGERGSSSMFEVPGDNPAPYDFQNVPHGTVHINYYESKTLSVPRRVDVYYAAGLRSGEVHLSGAVPAARVRRYPKPAGPRSAART